MIRLAFAIGFLSVFGLVAYFLIVFVWNKYFNTNKKTEEKKSNNQNPT